MSQAFGGWVLDHHALAAWARVEPYAQSLVWSAMEVGMSVVVPIAALPLAYAATPASDHDVLRALLDLPVTLRDQLTEADTPDLGRILACAAEPDALTFDALALACVVTCRSTSRLARAHGKRRRAASARPGPGNGRTAVTDSRPSDMPQPAPDHGHDHSR